MKRAILLSAVLLAGCSEKDCQRLHGERTEYQPQWQTTCIEGVTYSVTGHNVIAPMLGRDSKVIPCEPSGESKGGE